MKSLFVSLFAVIGMVFLTSCEKELESLANTSWKSTNNVGYWELFFSSDRCVITQSYADGSYESYEGPYTYDSPTVTMEYPDWDMSGTLRTRKAIGTVKGNKMTTEIMTGDLLWTLELEKQ